MSDKEEYMAKLDKLQRDVDWIISYLLKMNEPIQPPPPPPRYPTSPVPPDLNVTVCSKCGIEWKGVMGYVCRYLDCPVQPKTGSLSTDKNWQSYNVSNTTGMFDVESLDPDERSWYYDGDGTKRKKE